MPVFKGKYVAMGPQETGWIHAYLKFEDDDE
jgi:hypothetical protein